MKKFEFPVMSIQKLDANIKGVWNGSMRKWIRMLRSGL